MDLSAGDIVLPGEMGQPVQVRRFRRLGREKWLAGSSLGGRSVELRDTGREHSRSLSYREQGALAAVILNPGYSLDLPKLPL